jgi:hypothetical protein
LCTYTHTKRDKKNKTKENTGGKGGRKKINKKEQKH